MQVPSCPDSSHGDQARRHRCQEGHAPVPQAEPRQHLKDRVFHSQSFWNNPTLLDPSQGPREMGHVHPDDLSERQSSSKPFSCLPPRDGDLPRHRVDYGEGSAEVLLSPLARPFASCRGPYGLFGRPAFHSHILTPLPPAWVYQPTLPVAGNCPLGWGLPSGATATSQDT